MGQKIVTVATIDRLKVKFDVNVRDISFVSRGDKVAVYVDGSEQVAEGTVTAVDISADTFTRSFGIEALIDNKAHKYHPGTFVRVGLTVETLQDVMAVPRETIVNMNDSEGLFVVTNGIANFRPVRLGEELEGLVIVESGLTAGDTLVTLGQSYLDDGFKVKVIEMENSIR